MTRYQALRRIGCDPLAAGFIALMNWALGVPANEIRVMVATIEFDNEDTTPPTPPTQPQPAGLLNLLAEVTGEVRKHDEALIRQLVEAMEGVKALNMGGELALWTAEFDRLLSAIAAARARLESKP